MYGETIGQNEQTYSYNNYLDADGKPAGGYFGGMGIDIRYQRGPLGGNPADGAFVEEVIHAAIQRLEFYQTANEGQFACRENYEAIAHLTAAKSVLMARTAKRRSMGIEGQHINHEPVMNLRPGDALTGSVGVA